MIRWWEVLRWWKRRQWRLVRVELDLAMFSVVLMSLVKLELVWAEDEVMAVMRCSSFSFMELNSYVDLPDKGNTEPHCELPVYLNSTEFESQLSMTDQTNNQAYTKMVEMAYDCSKCSEEYVDIERGKSETLGFNEETVGNLRIEEGQVKSLQKEISFELGGKYMQFLMNHSLILPNFSAQGEKVAEARKMRKYKRTTSFNSRKVALVFSLLTSLGTIILIYLTLKVKQMSDASTHSE
ncbi:hypothetical protein R6Q57_003076 [Mikania cordata]